MHKMRHYRHCTVLLALLWAQTTTTATLLDTPNQKWNLSLNRPVRRGNAAVSHGNKLFVTAQDGSLHIVTELHQEEPEIIVVEPNAPSQCQSGVAVVAEPQKPPEDAIIRNDDDKTILQAVHFNGSPRWSVELEGKAMGTPVVGRNGFVYLSHNIGPNQGVVSVIAPTGPDSAVVTATLAPTEGGEMVWKSVGVFMSFSPPRNMRPSRALRPRHIRFNSFMIGNTLLLRHQCCLKRPCMLRDRGVMSLLGRRIGIFPECWKEGTEDPTLGGDIVWDPVNKIHLDVCEFVLVTTRTKGNDAL